LAVIRPDTTGFWDMSAAPNPVRYATVADTGGSGIASSLAFRLVGDPPGLGERLGSWWRRPQRGPADDRPSASVLRLKFVDYV
jgi:hypothetical protein